MRLLSSGRARWAALGTAVGAFAAGGIAYASIPDTGGVFHACYKKNGGQVRLVNSASDCTSAETAAEWNQTGPTGATGPTGPAGVSLFANVNGIDGTLLSGTATAATRYSAGVYGVTFNRDIRNCAATAAPGINEGSQGVISADGSIEQVNMGEAFKTPNPNTVTVWIRVQASAYGDDSFHLIVVC
jgi:hypothetical protein